MACTDVCAQVLADLIYDCNNKSIGGLVQTIKLINRCDIIPGDWNLFRNMGSTSPVTACNHSIAYEGENPATEVNAIKIQGPPGKRILNATFSSSDTDYDTYYTHTVNIFSQGLSEAALCNIKALGAGADVVAIVEQNFKGNAGADAFLVFGWDTGLKLGDITVDLNENNGNAIIPLTSKDPDLEPFPPMILNMGGYAAAKAFFDTI